MSVRALLAFVLLAAVGAASFLFAMQFFDEATPSAAENPTPVSVEEAATETPPPASLEDVETLVAELNAISQAEGEKPRFDGELGDFIVVRGDVFPVNYPCNGAREVAVAPDSELFYTLPGEQGSLYGPKCDDGTVFAAFGGREEGFVVERFLFVGAKPEVWIEAPLERIELTRVDGLTAIMALPVAELEAVHPYRTIYVVERFPSGSELGILLRVTGTGTADAMLSLVRHVLAQ
jgi:hypothetical protein